MKDSQLIKTLAEFTKTEMRNFEKFVNSPYFNTSAATVKLFYAVKEFYPSFSSDQLRSDLLFKKIYGSRKFSLTLFNKLSSNLIKLTEGFISQTNQVYTPHGLLYGLRKKKLNNRFLSHYGRESKKLDDNFFVDDNILLKQLFYDEYINYLEGSGDYRKADAEKHNSFEFTFMFFLYRVVLLYPRNRTFAKPEDPKTDLIQLIIKNTDFDILYGDIKGSALKNKEQLSHLLSLLLLARSGDERLYEIIKTYISANRKILDSNFMYPGYVYMLDHCSMQIARGNERFYRERYLIYREIEKGYFETGKIEMHITLFRNFIMSGILNGELKWAEEVLCKYSGSMIRKGLEVIVRFLEALLCFNRKDYESTVKFLAKCDSFKHTKGTLYFRYDIKLLRLMVYYELEYFEQALSIADSVLHIINKRENVKSLNRLAHINFIKYLKKLVQIKESGTGKGIDDLLRNAARENVYEKKWILKKAAELKERKSPA